MNIVIASAEAAPLAKAGGLADITSALAAEWKKYNQNPIIILPKYAFINVHDFDFSPTFLTLYVPMGNWVEFAHLWHGKLPGTDVDVYLIENNDYFNRYGIYGDYHEYSDNNRRFIFYCRALFEALKAIDFYPDIIHAHDYHAAFTQAFLKIHYNTDPRFSKTAGVYTIHNLAYQGKYPPYPTLFYAQVGLDQFYPASWFEHYGLVNFMKVGISFSDKITTVSPTYAQEIRMLYYGEGMQDVLNHRGADLIGILNGVYYEEWDPENDENLYSKYNMNFLQGKQYNKKIYLKNRGVNSNDNLDLPLIGMVTRLTEQKGIDLVINKLESMLDNNKFRFTILGSGEKRYEDYFNYIAWKYPGKAFVYIGYNNKLSHRILAASDYLLMPSRFEPCGLTQMYALRYGTIPIVRLTGGLADTIKEYNPLTGKGNGFRFWQYNADNLEFTISRALGIYQKEPHWNLIRQNAMSDDYSASKSALEYLKVFRWALEKVR